MSEGTVQGDAPEAERPLEANIGARQAQVAGAASAPGEIRERRGHGRRVNLIRDPGGQYAVMVGQRVIQTFCAEFEDITRFQLPTGIQQQVRINIQEMGQAREYSELDNQDEVAQDEPPVPDGVELRTQAHPNQLLSRASLEEMEIELPDRDRWQDNALTYLRAEQERIGDVIDMIARLS